MNKKQNSVKRLEIALICSSAAMVSAFAIISGSLLSASSARAENARVAAASVGVTDSCAMDAELDEAHEAIIPTGSYRSGIGKTTYTVTCNDPEGYAVYAIGFTNDELGNNALIGEETWWEIDSGVATSGSISNWAMKLTAISGNATPTIENSYDDFNVIPNDYVKVASLDDSTEAEPNGSQFEMTYAAYIAYSQTPDTYVGKVKYTLVHPNGEASAPCAGTYTIQYNANGGSGEMRTQEACVDKSVRLTKNTLNVPDDGEVELDFGNWNTKADGSGNNYADEQTVSNIGLIGKTVTLYAQWIPRYIQDFDAATCQAVATYEPVTVYDRRDGSDYTVRWIQGKCWMTRNLRITGTVYAIDSNFSVDRVASFNVCTNDLTVGDSYDQPRCHDSGNKENGVWYNYAAATAMQILGDRNSTLATQDICPSGWKLPAKGDVNITGTTYIDSFTPVSGGLYKSGKIELPNYGKWWTSTYENYGSGAPDMRRWVLTYNGSSMSLTNPDDFKCYGMYVRCVRKVE